MEVILSILVIVLLLLFGPTLVLLWKRLLLKYKLDRFCRAEKGRITWYRSPFAGIFTGQKGFDFVLSLGEKRYEVFLVSARYRWREHCFVSPTEISIYRKLKLFSRAGNVHLRRRFHSVNFGFTTRSLPIDLTAQAEEGAEKILLFYPVPKEVTRMRGTNKLVVGNGDELYRKLWFFTLSAFLEEVRGEKTFRRHRNPWEAE